MPITTQIVTARDVNSFTNASFVGLPRTVPTVAFRGFINSKEQQTEHRVQQHSIYSTVRKPIAMMFTEAITSMFTKTSMLTYYNITIK